MTPSPLKSVRTAVATLTVLPVHADLPQGGRTDAPGYYPMVGLLIGFIGAGCVFAFSAAGALRSGSLAIATIVVGVWAAVTRLLHWDGLADVADGFFAPTVDARLRIMRDSSIGAFGAFAIAIVLGLQIAAISTLVGREAYAPIVVAPVLGRLSATFGAWFGSPARSDGLGASITGPPRTAALAPALAVLLLTGVGIAWVEPIPGVIVMLAGIVGAAALPHVLSQRFGGVTGDVLGASVLLTEALVVFVAAWAW